MSSTNKTIIASIAAVALFALTSTAQAEDIIEPFVIASADIPVAASIAAPATASTIASATTLSNFSGFVAAQQAALSQSTVIKAETDIANRLAALEATKVTIID